MSKKPENYVGAVFDNPNTAHAAVTAMIDHNFMMDQVSILHRAGGQGDDVLGLAYSNEKQRFKIWGAEGALWGALGGLLAGAAGLVLLPGIGPVLIAGPLVDILAGAAVGTGLMTSGAAASHLTIAMRRMGIPEEKLNVLHQAIMNEKTVVIMHCGYDDPEIWHQRMTTEGAAPVFTMP